MVYLLISKSCCSRVRGLMPLRRRCQASVEARRARELEASCALSQATSSGEVATGAGAAVVVVVVTLVVVWVVTGSVQAQRWAPEEAEGAGRRRKTRSAAQERRRRSAGTVSSRAVEPPPDGSAIARGEAALDRRWWGWWRCCRWTALGISVCLGCRVRRDAAVLLCYLVWFDHIVAVSCPFFPALHPDIRFNMETKWTITTYHDS
jgi:hypothetical protein